MVVFTCNHCGDSLQKPRVEKHYTLQCRKPKNLTCVDCLKDFTDNFVEHIKCVTEEERYAAKGAHPNGIVKKGDTKQEAWMEMIRSIVRDGNFNTEVKTLLDSILNYSNVPRKKPKFINFMKSCFGNRYQLNTIESVWGEIEKYKTQAQNSQATKPVTKADGAQGEDEKTDENKNGVAMEGTTDVGMQKKKRKRDNNEGKNQVPVSESNDSQREAEKCNGNENGIATQEASDNGVQKKKRKQENNEDEGKVSKKKSKKDGSETVKIISNILLKNDDSKENKPKKKKNKKAKNQPADEAGQVLSENTVSTENENNTELENASVPNENKSNKKKNKKAKNEQAAGADQVLSNTTHPSENNIVLENHSISNDNKSNRKKNKKAKNEQAAGIDQVIPENTLPTENKKSTGLENTSVSDENKSNKEKKNKRSDIEETNAGNEENKIKKKKNKQKENQSTENGILNGDNTADLNDEKPKENGVVEKNQKKKRKCEQTETEENKSTSKKKKIAETNGNTENEAIITENSTNGTVLFSYKESILEILNKSNTISLGKLQKKILKNYTQKVGEMSDSNKVLKRINKELKKLNVTVQDDTVTLAV